MSTVFTCPKCGKSCQCDRPLSMGPVTCWACGFEVFVPSSNPDSARRRPVHSRPDSDTIAAVGKDGDHETQVLLQAMSEAMECIHPERREAIDAHMQQYLGDDPFVFHEIISTTVHLDIFVFRPTPERDYFTLVTQGMSDRAMTVQTGDEDSRYAELMIYLPPDWPLQALHQAPTVSGDGSEDDEEEDPPHYWPIHWLKLLGRFPHEYDTVFHASETVGSEDSSDALGPGTRLSGFVLLPPPEEDGFEMLTLPDGEKVNFYALMPIYPEEMKFRFKHSSTELIEKLGDADVSVIIDPQRRNVCKKKWGLF